MLRLPPASLMDQNIQAAYNLYSIKSISVPLEMKDHEPSETHFAIYITTTYHYTTNCNIDVRSGTRAIQMKGLESEASTTVTQTPACNSLFFQPVFLPDITKIDWNHGSSRIRSLSDIAELVTHKWPMSDIVIGAMPKHSVIEILQAFDTLTPDRRSYLRSIQCIGDRLHTVPERVQFVENLGEVARCHIIFWDGHNSMNLMLEKLDPGGFVCTSGPSQKLDSRPDFRTLSCFKGSELDQWSLHQKIQCWQTPKERNIVLFTDIPGSLVTHALSNADRIPLEPVSVAHICDRIDVEAFDNIVIDDQQKPIITSWPGIDLMPWLQVILKSANALL